jgi:transcriptional regulator with XRE-family HTH domain
MILIHSKAQGQVIGVKNFNEKIGKRIYDLRTQSNYTREYLAEISNISDNFLYEIETGRKGLSATTLYQVSQSLNVTMDYLANGEIEAVESCVKCYLLRHFNAKDREILEEIISKIFSLSCNK